MWFTNTLTLCYLLVPWKLDVRKGRWTSVWFLTLTWKLIMWNLMSWVLSGQMTSNFQTTTVINYNYKFGWHLRAWQSCHCFSCTIHTFKKDPTCTKWGGGGGKEEKWPQISKCIIYTCEKVIFFLHQPTDQLTNLFNLVRKLLLALEKH